MTDLVLHMSTTPSPFARRAALVILQLGALAVVLVAAPFKSFELDRFFVPKELALHVAALLAALCALWSVRRITLDRVDTLLASFGILSVISALFATNHWNSARALAITLSGLAVFWAARAVAAAGLRRPLVIALVVAVVVGAGTGLLQAYGLRTEYASLARAPGGTFGNRNFMAHLCAIGAPLLLWCTATAKRSYGVVLGSIAALMMGAALVLSRTRAAWVALGVCAVLLIVPLWLALKHTEDSRAGRRIALLGLCMAIGGLASLMLPNHLNWKSDSPYMDSVKGVVDYSSGSGKGRLVQYKNTLRMAAAHPVLGVGPGNWPVHYPKFASKRDPSLSRETGRPSNPWPSSDWVAMIAERGPLATLIFVLAYFGLLVSGWRQPAEVEEASDSLAPVALMGALVATAIVGAFDAVLLLGAPTLIAWSAFGALSVPGKPRLQRPPEPDPGHRPWKWMAVATVVGLLMIGRSAAQLIAMSNDCSNWTAVTFERCRTSVR